MMLKLNHIHTYYDHIEVIKGVCLQINKGQIVTLLGANGAGKTTILKTISGLVHPRKGEVIFLGERIDMTPPEVRVSMGISQVPEGRRIFPRMSVAENLEIGAYARKDRKEVTKDLKWIFELFPILAERRHQLGATLSGGEQQMLAIARGLMSRPKLLMLDEPSMGLAPFLVKKIFEVIKEIKNMGITILLVEQNAFLALQISDFSYVLETGRVVAEGPANELLFSEKIKKAYLGE